MAEFSGGRPIGSKAPLREFLFAYGSDVKDARSAFVPLAECFEGSRVDGEDDVAARLVQIGAAFPDPSDALCLKKGYLERAARESSSGQDLDAIWAASYFLLRAQEAPAFDRVSFDFASRARALWQRKRADVVALLDGLPETERTRSFLSAVAASLVPGELRTLWSEQPAALPRLVACHPALAGHASAWAMPEPGQRALWQAVTSSTTDERMWATICAAMLEAQCNFAQHETVVRAGKSLPDGLLSWLRAGNVSLPSSAWRDALREPLSKVLQSGDLAPPLVALAAWTLPPARARSLSGRRRDVQKLAQNFSGVPESLLAYSLFWLTAVGLQTSGSEGLKLLVRGFFSVYQAVERSEYPRDAWEVLAPVLPEPFLGLDWDRCLRLRRALREWLRGNPDLTSSLAQAAPTAEGATMVLRLRS